MREFEKLMELPHYIPAKNATRFIHLLLQHNFFFCGKIVPTKSLRLDLSKYGIRGDIQRVDCKICDNFIAIKKEDEEENDISNGFINFDEPVDGINLEISWKEAKTEKERIAYYVLSQIIYPERDPPDPNEHESTYDFADESDLVVVRWERGVPIAFYTIKLKGTVISSTNEEYAMNTLDTAYVRSEYRNRGIGSEIISQITEICSNQEIGFSSPVSNGMWKVLKKFLTTHIEYRYKFWEIMDGGNAGNRKLIWFTLKKQKQTQKKDVIIIDKNQSQIDL